jgi:hypothetical protein
MSKAGGLHAIDFRDRRERFRGVRQGNAQIGEERRHREVEQCMGIHFEDAIEKEVHL